MSASVAGSIEMYRTNRPSGDTLVGVKSRLVPKSDSSSPAPFVSLNQTSPIPWPSAWYTMRLPSGDQTGCLS